MHSIKLHSIVFIWKYSIVLDFGFLDRHILYIDNFNINSIDKLDFGFIYVLVHRRVFINSKKQLFYCFDNIFNICMLLRKLYLIICSINTFIFSHLIFRNIEFKSTSIFLHSRLFLNSRYKLLVQSVFFSHLGRYNNKLRNNQQFCNCNIFWIGDFCNSHLHNKHNFLKINGDLLYKLLSTCPAVNFNYCFKLCDVCLQQSHGIIYSDSCIMHLCFFGTFILQLSTEL